jgi:anti-anti-sigma regulatory factor
MLSIQPIAPQASDRRSVVVDLIGDLDATLGGIFADALAELTADGRCDVFVTTRHVTLSSADGLAAMNDALDQAREKGCSIAVDPGNRRMRAAFANARLGYPGADEALRPFAARHLMIARHAQAQSPATRRSA